MVEDKDDGSYYGIDGVARPKYPQQLAEEGADQSNQRGVHPEDDFGIFYER